MRDTLPDLTTRPVTYRQNQQLIRCLDTDANLLPAETKDAQLQRTIGIVGVKWLAIQVVNVIYGQITVAEEDHMGAVLPRDGLANRTVAGVVIDRFVIGVGVNVVAPAGILV